MSLLPPIINMTNINKIINKKGFIINGIFKGSSCFVTGEAVHNKQTGYGVKLMDGGYYRFIANDCISFECLPEKSSQI